MQQTINFVKLLKHYKSGWVAISSDFSKVVLSGKTLKEVREKAKQMKEKLYFFPAGESYGDFVGTAASAHL
jgi:NADPH-dependent ferric siderophore reductase